MTSKLRDRLYFYSSVELPMKLMQAMVENIGLYSCNNKGRVGIMGVTRDVAEEYGYRHLEMFNYDMCFAAGARHFKKMLKEIRFNLPGIRLEEWYLFTLACYCSGQEKVIDSMKKLDKKEWDYYKARFSSGVEFSEKVWERFKSIGGEIT